MSNVIVLPPRVRIEPLSARLAALASSFAECRRSEEDVFWLKENAELLNIVQATRMPATGAFLTVYEPFYAAARDRLRFFPQYYRFLLSMVLDLEDLGMPGDEGQAMVDLAARRGLPQAEISDLQRAEARRLMGRRGIDPLRDLGLDDRLRAFAARSETFSLPNKKAAYELTHIVFYLSDYGRIRPDLPAPIVQSLHFAGLIAYLDRNTDLLAEVCIALHYLGQTPPEAWTRWLLRETARFEVQGGAQLSVRDDYHDFLVCNWCAATLGTPVFRKPLTPERLRFDRPPPAVHPLREVSRALLNSTESRHADWTVTSARLGDRLSEETLSVLEDAARSSDHFDAFFAGFSRAQSA